VTLFAIIFAQSAITLKTEDKDKPQISQISQMTEVEEFGIRTELQTGKGS